MQKSKPVSFKFSSKVKINFEGGRLSSDSGLLLIHEFCEQFGVQGRMKELFPENREGSFKHSKSEILYQELIRIIAGYPSNNTASFLQHDPVFQEIHGEIASPSTCCRLEKEFTIEDLKAFQTLQTKLLELAYEIEKPKDVILDLDTTYDPASPDMQGSNFNRHYGTTGFSPLICTDSLTGDMIKANLRPGNTHCSKKVMPFLTPIFEWYQKQNIAVKSRMDSAFASPKIYRICEQFNAKYIIRMRRNAVLKRKVDEFTREMLTKEEWEKREEIFTEIQYKAKSWKKSRRILLHIYWPEGELFPQYAPFVTNLEEYDIETCIKFYRGRAKMERDIDESKNGFSSDHLSQQSFTSNQVRYQIFIMAQLIVNLFRRFTFPEKQRPWLIQTIRQFLTKVASKAVKNGRDVIFKCASCCPHQDLFLKILENIQSLPRFG